MLFFLASLVLLAPELPAECQAPPAREVTALSVFAQRSGSLSVGLDSVATWCFESGGSWSGGHAASKGKPPANAEPSADCARALRSCETAQAALPEEGRQLLFDTLAELEQPFLGVKYKPKRSGLAERPPEAVDCGARVRSTLFAQAQARMDIARLASQAQSEYANYRTWLFSEGLRCAQAVARGQKDVTRRGINIDKPVQGGGMQRLPQQAAAAGASVRLDGGSVASAGTNGTGAAGEGGAAPTGTVTPGTTATAGSSPAATSTTGTAGSSTAGASPTGATSLGTTAAGATAAGTTAAGTTATGKTAAGTTAAGTTTTGTTAAGTTTAGTTTTGTTAAGTTTAGTTAAGTTAAGTTAAGTTATGATASGTTATSLGAAPIGGPTAERERALASSLVEKWRYFAAQRVRLEADPDWTDGFLASRELRECRCARQSAAELLKRLESGDRVAAIEADDEKLTRCEVCLEDAYPPWKRRAQAQCALLLELSPYEIGALERSDDGNGLPPRCIEAARKRTAAAAPVSSRPAPQTGSTGSGAFIITKAPPPTVAPADASDFVKPSDYAPIPQREAGRVYVRIFTSAACVAEVLPGPMVARTGDLLPVPVTAKEVTVRGSCGGLVEVYFGQEEKPRVSDSFSRTQPLRLQFRK